MGRTNIAIGDPCGPVRGMRGVQQVIEALAVERRAVDAGWCVGTISVSGGESGRVDVRVVQHRAGDPRAVDPWILGAPKGRA